MNMRVVKPVCETVAHLASAANPKTEKLQFWHERLCHQNKKHVQEFIQREGVDVPTDDYFCEACAFGKSHPLPFYSHSCRANQPGEIIHADVCGPMEIPSLRDDGLVAATHTEDCRDFLANLTAEFKITSGPVSCFLGVEVVHLHHSGIVHQESTRQISYVGIKTCLHS